MKLAVPFASVVTSYDALAVPVELDWSPSMRTVPLVPLALTFTVALAMAALLDECSVALIVVPGVPVIALGDEENELSAAA